MVAWGSEWVEKEITVSGKEEPYGHDKNLNLFGLHSVGFIIWGISKKIELFK